MEILQALFLGALQGVTEFLPVSSSGHLVLAQHFLGFSSGDSPRELFFDGFLHLGTLLAVLVYFGKEIRSNLRSAVDVGAEPETATQAAHVADSAIWPSLPGHFVRLAILVGLATLPAVVLALWKAKAISDSFNNPRMVAGNFLLLGGILGLTDWLGRRSAGSVNGPTMQWWHAVIIGCAQGCSALFRGLSRSGMTIATSLLVGLERTWAVRFSFLMSIFASGGLCLLGLRKALQDPARAEWLTVGFLGQTALATLVSAAVGYLTIGWLIQLVKKCRLWWFGAYVFVVGVAVLLFEPQILGLLQGAE